MKNCTIGGHAVQVYDSIEDLPIRRFQKFNKLLLLDSAVGSDVNAINAHVRKLAVYAKNKDLDNLQKELTNYRQNLYFIVENVSPKFKAFAALVYSIDGKVQGCNDDDLENIINTLSLAKVSEIETIAEESKKKIDSEIAVYFPSLQDTSERKEIYDLIRARALLQLDTLKGNDNSAKIDELTEKILIFSKPQNCLKLEVENDKNFEKICLTLSAELKINAKTLSVFEFYTAVEHLREIAKEREKAFKNG